MLLATLLSVAAFTTSYKFKLVIVSEGAIPRGLEKGMMGRQWL